MRRILIVLAVAAWQIEMSVECAMKCIHRPAAPAQTIKASKPATAPECKGASCPQPQPKPPAK
jgi:hypothetical protein